MIVPRSIIPVAACVALLAGGCGSSGGSGDRLSKSDYQQQATKICTDSEAATNKLTQPTKPADVKPFLQKGIAITQKAVDDFKALKPPSDLQDEHNAVVKAEQNALDELQKVTDSLKGDTSDAAKVQAASPELDKISKDVDAKLKAAGLPKCASS
jgi:cytochrome c556